MLIFVKEVLRNLAISLVLTIFGSRSKKLDFVHQTVSSQETHIVWVQDEYLLRRSCSNLPVLAGVRSVLCYLPICLKKPEHNSRGDKDGVLLPHVL